MPKQRNFDSLYKSLNIKREIETPRIPEEERPSNNLKESDHSMCDFLFEEYKDRKGKLLYKCKVYRVNDFELTQFKNCLIKDLKGEI